MKQLYKIAGFACAALGLLAGIHSAAAHHSGAMFDHSKQMTINGAIKEVRWVNPHVTLTILGTVKEGQEPTPYLLEMTSPSVLSRLGWTKSTFKPGDQVKAEFSPLFDAEQHGGSLRSITSVETGKTFVPNLIEQENIDNN
jgi:hypothetical protein